MKRLYRFLVLAALLWPLAATAQDGPIWNALSGVTQFGPTSVGARYSSPGLTQADMASVVLYWSGNVPLDHFQPIRGGTSPDDFIDGVLGRKANADLLRIWTSYCGAGLSGSEMRNCLADYAWDGATLDINLMLDLSEAAWADDPVVRPLAFGLKAGTDGDFYPILWATESGYCEGEEGTGFCAACYSRYGTMSAGEEPRPCQARANEDPPTLYVINAGTALSPFQAVRARIERDGGTPRLAVRFRKQSGRNHDINLSMNGFFDALLARR